MKSENDNKPRMAVRGEWIVDEFFPESSQARLDKREVELKRRADGRVISRMTRQIAKRQEIGSAWDGKADNDNINWPLATALIREGNMELLKAAMAYRKTHAEAHSGAVLGGQGVSVRDGFSLDRHIHIRPNGTIAYKHVRQRTAASVDIPSTMKVTPYANEDDGVEKNSIRVPKAWNGDKPVNDKLDAQARLIAMRARLGVLAEPLEMAAVDGLTYEAIGRSLGEAHKVTATAAGRTAIHMALITIRDSLGDINRDALAA